MLQLYRSKADGNRWAVRYDGRVLQISADGKVREFPGLASGEPHLPVYGDIIHSRPTGTVCVRLGQVYLLDRDQGR